MGYDRPDADPIGADDSCPKGRTADEAVDEDAAGSAARAPGRLLWRFGPLAALIALLAIGYAFDLHRYLTLSYLAESHDVLRGFVSARYTLALIGFVIAYGIAVAAAFPAASVLSIFGGFLFGWLVGALAIAIGATAGATTLFLAARYAFRDALRARLGRFTSRLAHGFEKDAFGYLLVLRLAPFFPFFVINIAPAFFKVDLRSYVAATFLGILPGCFAYAWLGAGIDSVIASTAEAGRSVGLSDLVTPQITIAFAALAAMALISTLAKRWWLAKKETGESGERSTQTR